MAISLQTSRNKNITNNTQPKYRLLAQQFRQQIEEKELLPGDRLPSFSEICREYGITVTTANQVYSVLEQEGFIERRQGSGTFVCEPKRTLTGNIGVIGIESFHLQQAHYYNYILQGIEEFAAKNEQHVLLLGSCKDLDRQAVEKVDGVLLCHVEYAQHRLKHMPASLPQVSMFTKENELTNVIADDFDGAKQAVQHLQKKGHQRIACLMEKYMYIPTQRFAGYCAAFTDASAERRPEWARLTDVITFHKNTPAYLHWGRSNMRQWLDEGFIQLDCTAILTQNDAAAIGVMQVLQEEGINVPGQVSVMGFDGTDLCEHITPRLCSMKMPLAEIGYNAAYLLQKHIHNEQNIHTVMLPMTLRDGESVTAISGE